MSAKPVLYSYFRSSCSWRVRIALELKGVRYEYKPVNLLQGEQNSDAYQKVNPIGGVPTLVVDGHPICQSLAIIEYLDEKYPDPSLLPEDPIKRADVRKLALIIAADIQPVQNLRVLKFVGDEKKMELGHWTISNGFAALEKCLKTTAGKYCYGNEITMVDLCLIPQIFNAHRFKVDMSSYPTICRIQEELNKLDAFKKSHPTQQPDCPEDLKETGR